MGHRNFIDLSIIVVGVSLFVSGIAAVNKQMVRGVLYTKKLGGWSKKFSDHMPCIEIERSLWHSDLARSHSLWNGCLPEL
jgi:hypothetical protein